RSRRHRHSFPTRRSSDLCPNDRHLLVGGDLNGHVGVSPFSTALGGHGFGEVNSEGWRIRDWATALNLCVVNTFFLKSQMKTVTYRRGSTESQIDYWCLRRKSLKLVTDCKVIPQELSAQHQPVYL